VHIFFSLSITRIAAFLFGCSLVAACGGSGGDSTTGSASGGNSLNACEVLRAANPAEVLGGDVDQERLIFDQRDGNNSASQCKLTASGTGRAVGLLLRRAKGSKAPASRQEFIDGTREANDMGAGDDTANALEAGRQIPGIGDLALTYDLFSYNLMVWNADQQFTVMLDGFGNGEEAEAAAVRVAKDVLATTH
jgi:hypothetical protein